MNILFVDAAVLPGDNSRTSILAKKFCQMGDDVTIINSNYYFKRKENDLDKNGKEVVDGITYITINVPVPNDFGKEFKKHCKKFAKALKRMCKMGSISKYKAIIVSSTTPYAVEPVIRYTDKQRIYFAYDICTIVSQDLLENFGLKEVTQEDRGLLEHKNFVYKMKSYERQGYNYSQKVISGLEYADRHLVSIGLSAKGYYVNMPNAVDVSDIKPPVFSKSENMKVLFCADENLRGLDDLFKAADNLEHVELNIARAEKETEIKDFASKYKVKVNIGSKEELMDDSDMIYYLMSDDPLNRYGEIPIDFLETMKLGKPIIQSDNKLNDMVGKAVCGKFVEFGDVETLKANLELFSGMPKQNLMLLGANGVKHIVENHNIDIMAEKYKEFLNKKYETVKVYKPEIFM